MKIEKEKRLKMKRTDHCQGAQQRIVNKILEEKSLIISQIADATLG